MMLSKLALMFLVVQLGLSGCKAVRNYSDKILNPYQAKQFPTPTLTPEKFLAQARDVADIVQKLYDKV